MLPFLVVDQTQASESSEQENFGEIDRQTIKYILRSNLSSPPPLINVINIDNQ